MTKKFTWLMVFVLAAAWFLKAPRALAVDGQLDQSCIPHTFSQSDITGLDAFQTFKPKEDHLTQVSIWLNGAGRYKIRVTKHTTGENLASFTLNGPGAGLSKWVDINFSSIIIEKDRLYAIHLEGIDGRIKWGYSWDASPDSCYPPGTGVKDGLLINADWMFKTFGYSLTALTPNPEASLPVITETSTPTPPSDLTPTPGETSPETIGPDPNLTENFNLGQPPSENINSAISPPTDVDADFLNFAGKNIVRITWQASETKEIGGYTVFRKTADTQYGQIGRLDSALRAYDDEAIHVGDSQFTYIVRAFQGEQESANSNEATVDVFNEKNIDLNNKSKEPFLTTWSIIVLSLLGLILLGAVGWYIYKRKKNRQSSNKH